MSDLQTLLICAAANGPAHLHAAMKQKLASLRLTAEDAFAVVAMLNEELAADETNQFKQAAAGRVVTASLNPSLVRSLALGTMLSVPAAGFIRGLQQQKLKDEGWANLVNRAPDLHQQDPERLRAVYDLMHSTAPNLAQNSVVAGDVARQMMSMPLVDVGTVSRLATTGKDMASSSGDGSPSFHDNLEALPNRLKAVQLLTSGKTASFGVPVSYTDPRGVKCAINWASPAMKEAGITDLVGGSNASAVGSGTALEQANNAFDMNQSTMGTNMLPLDAVVRELMMKEQELSQREEALMQQEMAMQQAQAMYGQMGPAYQDQTGVDPQTGAPMQPEAQPEGQPEGQPAGDDQGLPPGADQGEQQPPMGGQGEMPPGADQGLPPGADQGEQPPAPGQDEPPAPGANDMPPDAVNDQLAQPGEAVPAAGPTGAPMPAVDESQAVTAPAEGVTDAATGEPGATGAQEDAPSGLPKDSMDQDQAEAGGAAPADVGQPETPPAGGTEEPTPPPAGGELPPEPAMGGELPPAEPAPPAAEDLPPDAPLPVQPSADPAGLMGMPPEAGGSALTPNPDGSMTMTIPLPSLQISIKAAEVLLNPNVPASVDSFIASLRL